MKLNKNQKLFTDIIISLLEQMYEKHNGTLNELCNPVRNANKEMLINELSQIMFKYNIEDTCLNIGKVQQIKLYKELCSKINKMFANEYKAEKDCISDILSQTAKDSYYVNSFVTSIGISYTLKPVSNKILQEIINHKIDGKMWSERLWDDKVNLRKDLKLQVRKFLNGEINVNNISDAIEKKYGNNRYVTNRLVNNEISIVQEDANDVWREEHNIKNMLYMGTLDRHICSKCAKYDGKTYEVGKQPVDLPQHVGCRCTYVNIPSPDWRPAERLDNDTKQRIPWQEYEKWHKNENNITKEEKTITSSKNTIIKTVEDAKKALVKDVGFIEVEDSFMKNVDEKLIINNTNQLLKLEDKFGVIHNSQSTIFSSDTGKELASTNCSQTFPTRQTLSLSKTGYKDFEEMINTEKYNIKSGYFMPCGLTDYELSVGSVTHEYGHMLQNRLIQNEMEKNGWSESKPMAFINAKRKTPNAVMKWYNDIIKKVNKNNYDEILFIAKKNNPDFDFNLNISKYGKTNYSEFFSEVFMNSQLSEPNELGIAMQEWLKEKNLINKG